MIRCALSRDALGCYLGLIPWPVYVILAVAAALVVWVLYDKISGIFRGILRWGGWRAGVAALLGLVAIVVAIWPRKHVTTEEQYGIPPVKPKKKRPTIFDSFRK